MRRRTRASLVGLLCLVALALRLHDLLEQPLWLDEVKLLFRASPSSPLGVLARLATDNQAPLYDFLMWSLCRMFGDGPLVARLPPALFGTLLVPVSYKLAGTVFRSHAAGFVTAFWTACSPYLVRYGQEARPYALAALLAGLTLWSAARILSTRGRRGAVPLGLAAAALVLTHYYGVLLVAAVALHLGWRAAAYRERLSAVAWAVLAAVAAGLVWAPVALHQSLATEHHQAYSSFSASQLVQVFDALGPHGVLVLSGGRLEDGVFGIPVGWAAWAGRRS